MTDSRILREHLDLIQQSMQTPLTEAFGAPMGLRQELTLWAKSFSNPAAASQLVAGNYANTLNYYWRQKPVENATGTDLITWLSNLTGNTQRPVSKIGEQYITQIVSQVTNNDLDKVLNADDLTKIFLGLGKIQQRQVAKMHTRLLKKGNQEQESRALNIIQDLRQKLPVLGPTWSLARLADLIMAKDTAVDMAGMQAGMKAFERDYNKQRPQELLPVPFLPTNTTKLPEHKTKLLIRNLGDLILEIVIVSDQLRLAGGGPPPPPPTPTPTPADQAQLLKNLVDSLRSAGETDDMIKFILSNLSGRATP